MLFARILITLYLIKICLAEEEIEERIIGGKEVPQWKKGRVWPFLVSLQHFKTFKRPKARGIGEYLHQCGGSIISENQVLTASHCFDGSKCKFKKKKSKWICKKPENDPKDWIIVTGKSDNSIENNTIHRHTRGWKLQHGVFKVKDIVKGIHPKYKVKTFKDDVTIVTVQGFFNFKKKAKRGFHTLKPATLGDFNPTDWQPCKVAGWGLIEPIKLNHYPAILREVRVPIRNTKECAKEYKNLGSSGADRLYEDKNICAGETDKDSCVADSGGPLLCENRSKKWVLSGTVSFGADKPKIGFVCGDNQYPGVYARVTYYKGWINQRRKAERCYRKCLKQMRNQRNAKKICKERCKPKTSCKDMWRRKYCRYHKKNSRDFCRLKEVKINCKKTCNEC